MKIIRLAVREDRLEKFIKYPNAKRLIGEDLYACIEVMVKVRDISAGKTINDGILKDAISQLGKKNEAKCIGQLSQLNNFFHSSPSGASSLLRPWVAILDVAAGMANPIKIDHLEESLDLIYSGMSKVSIEDKKNVFSSLLRMFSNDVSNAAKKAKMDNLASAIMSQGILADPNSLGRYIKIYPATQVMVQKAGQIAEYIIRYPNISKVNNYYQYIKGQCFDFVGEIDLEEIKRNRQQNQMKEDYKSFMSTKDKSNADFKTEDDQLNINIDEAKWLSPWVLTMLSSTLHLMYYNIINTSEERMDFY